MKEKKKILVMDDEADVRTFIKVLLEDNGYLVEAASNGEEGLEVMKRFQPDLITLDISMPGKSGIKFYREIKERPETSAIPVVVITGVTGLGGDPDVFRRFINTRRQIPPPEAFVPKPIDKDYVIACIAKLLNG
ncbi:MAG: response regulator [Deltaproteobacteria bacterium]|nr:response regulator [Deltaproteobacteria bacterium]